MMLISRNWLINRQPLWADTPVEKVVPGIIQADLSCAPQFFKALYLDVVIPPACALHADRGILRVHIEVIVVKMDL